MSTDVKQTTLFYFRGRGVQEDSGVMHASNSFELKTIAKTIAVLRSKTKAMTLRKKTMGMIKRPDSAMEFNEIFCELRDVLMAPFELSKSVIIALLRSAATWVGVVTLGSIPTVKSFSTTTLPFLRMK